MIIINIEKDDFICRNFSINWILSKNNFKIKKAKEAGQNTNINGSLFEKNKERIAHQNNNINRDLSENYLDIKNYGINYQYSYINGEFPDNNSRIIRDKITEQNGDIIKTKCEYIKIVLKTIWSIYTFRFIYYVLYIIFVLFEYLYYPFFYGFTLIINRVDLISSVLKSLYVPKLYLLINLLMFVMLEYFFSFFALSFFTIHFPIRGIWTYLEQSLDQDYVQYTPRAYAGQDFGLIFYFIFLLFY